MAIGIPQSTPAPWPTGRNGTLHGRAKTVGARQSDQIGRTPYAVPPTLVPGEPPARLQVCQAATLVSSQSAAAKPGASNRWLQWQKPGHRQWPDAIAIRLSRRRARRRAKDLDRQRYRDHDMVLIEPSNGTMIGLARCPSVRDGAITNRQAAAERAQRHAGGPGRTRKKAPRAPANRDAFTFSCG
jgi:hypothetical protein